MSARARAIWVSATVGLWAPPALATPGMATRLSGAEAQGPAARTVTAIVHNPAALALSPGFQFASSGRAGIDAQRVRRFEVDAAGQPTEALGPAESVVNPAGGAFVGGSLFVDPVAIGIAAYDLGNRYRPNAPSNSRYQAVHAPGVGRGAVETHNEVAFSLAYHTPWPLSVGGSLQIPILHQTFARDDDLTTTGGDIDCSERAEDPACAERIAVRTTTRGVNFVGTLGVALEVGERVIVGARYRSPAWLNRARARLSGGAIVCRPPNADNIEDADGTLDTCSTARRVDTTTTVAVPQSAALGVSFLGGRKGAWELQANLEWIDRCPLGAADCRGRDGRRLNLVGLDQNAAVLPDSTIYRGHQDRWRSELWGRVDVWRINPDGRQDRPPQAAPRVGFDILGGASFATPGVRPGSITAVDSDGWQIGGTLGAALEVPTRVGSWTLIPGYGVDISARSRVGPGGATPDYDPSAAEAFEQANGDLNHPSAAAVLAGRARPTNAGTYGGAVHTLLFAIRWSERG